MMLITNIIFVNNLIRWSFKGTWLISSISQEFSEQLPTQIITYHHWEWCNFSLKLTPLLPAHNIGLRKYCFRSMIFKDLVSFSNSTFKKSKYWKNTYLMLFWHNLGEEKTQHLKNLLFYWLYHIVYRLLVLYMYNLYRSSKASQKSSWLLHSLDLICRQVIFLFWTEKEFF